MHDWALIVAVALGAVGQLFLKMGSIQGRVSGDLITLPAFVGLLIYFGSALLYIYSLRKIPLYLAFPSMSASYALVAYSAHLIWGDPFGPRQIVGLAMITAGIVCLVQR
jgi:small multidrug resistance pump